MYPSEVALGKGRVAVVLDAESQKRVVGEWAAQQVTDGMIVGLGTGSTASHMVRSLAERVRAGLRCRGIATSTATDSLARSLGISMTSLDEVAGIDLAIDGADEVDGDLQLIKGLGGALLREKLVELRAQDLLIIVDHSKLVTRLGERASLPVEIVPFAWKQTHAAVEATGCTAALRGGVATPFLTDGGHYILDCRYPGIEDALALAASLKLLPGVVEHGLFLNMATAVAWATPTGEVQTRRRR